MRCWLWLAVAACAPLQPLPRPALLRERARIEIFPRSEWLVADVRARVRTRGAAILPFSFDAHRLRPPRGCRLTEVSQDGVLCRYASAAGKLVVELVRAAAEVELRPRYQGAPRSGADDLTGQDVALRGEVAWLPTLSGSNTEFSVQLVSDMPLVFCGQGQRKSAGQLDALESIVKAAFAGLAPLEDHPIRICA